MKNLPLILVLSLFAITAYAQPLKKVTPSEAGMDPVRLSQVDRIIEESINNGEIPGAVLAVVRDGKMAYLKAVTFTDFDNWYAFDVSNGYNTCGYLARIAKSSDELSDLEQRIEINNAIDEILSFNLTGNYIKVTKDYYKDKTMAP